MMKKLLIALAVMVGVSIGAQARDEYSRDVNTLPETARTTLKNGVKAKVTLIKIEKDFGRVDEYEVILDDGSEVTFGSDGKWKNVETAANNAVPDYFVLEPIRNYIKKQYGGNKITGIERVRKGYEVELSNGIDLLFASNGAFLGIDN